MRTIFEPVCIASTAREFLSDVISGLCSRSPGVPSRYFYDHLGSILFDQICELEEYYPTRVEIEVMSRFVGQMVDRLGSNIRLLQYGSGSSKKTRILLNNLVAPAEYVQIDICRAQLMRSSSRLRAAYPRPPIKPVVADITSRFSFAEGAAIRTEYSHKYTATGFAVAADQVGWRCEQVWTDPLNYFAVMYLERNSVDQHAPFSFPTNIRTRSHAQSNLERSSHCRQRSYHHR